MKNKEIDEARDAYKKAAEAQGKARDAYKKAAEAVLETPEFKAKEEAWKLMKATPEWKDYDKAKKATTEWKALEATPAYKTYDAAWEAMEATPEYKAFEKAEEAYTKACKAYRETINKYLV